MEYIDFYENDGDLYWYLKLEDHGGVYTTPATEYGENCVYEHPIRWLKYIDSRLEVDYSGWDIYEGGKVEDIEELEELNAAIISYYADGDNMTDEEWSDWVDNN